MKKSIYLCGILMILVCANVFGQIRLPQESQRAEVAQTVGVTRVALVYHRPNVKGREIFGCTSTDVVPKGGATYPCLVPNGQVWRTGANDNTTFEINYDAKINGKALPAGKYGLHAIPNQNEWTIIFSKTNDSWGSFSYKAENDQLRVTAKPQAAEFQETMSLNVENIKGNTADVIIRWGKLSVPFTIETVDVKSKAADDIRSQLKNVKADDFKSRTDAASYIYRQKMTANYAEAIGWLDASLKIKETSNALGLKAYLQAETGNKTEAIVNAEKAVRLAKAANAQANTTELEKRIAEWKATK